MKSLEIRRAERAKRREEAGVNVGGDVTTLDDTNEGDKENSLAKYNKAELRAYIEEKGGTVDGDPLKEALLSQALELQANNNASGNGAGTAGGWGTPA